MVGQTANQILGHGTCVAAHNSHSAAAEQAGLVSPSSSKHMFLRINWKAKIFKITVRLQLEKPKPSYQRKLLSTMELSKNIIKFVHLLLRKGRVRVFEHEIDTKGSFHGIESAPVSFSFLVSWLAWSLDSRVWSLDFVRILRVRIGSWFTSRS